MGRVRQAYALNDNEVENAIQALWPDAVFPLELWRKAYETYWRAFADINQAAYKVEGPALPELDTEKKYFHTHLCALDVLAFFKKMSEIIQGKVLQEGLRYILEESYEEIDVVFPEEREFLFSTLLRLETTDPLEQYEQYSKDEFVSAYEEKILYIPHSSYHFIAQIFPDTVLVDTVAIIRHFPNYPLRQEVKGLMQRIVDYVLNLPEPEASPTPKIIAPPSEPAAEEQPLDQKPIFRVPASFWEWKSDAYVRDAMKDEYPLFVIAFVLVNWCGVTKAQASHKTPKGRKTHVGRLLAEKEYKDDKSYRNFIDPLLEEAGNYTILKA